ncbi:MAG: pyridoxal phosphate-dependent aminotransferase, partial [Bacillales bacterium]|nr:pyridoxal phosphate-dependent aminotransferase [Bacillales bacterium]
EQFALRLMKEAQVIIIPGTAFGERGEGFLRLSYAYSLDELKEALNRIEKFLKDNNLI